MNCPTYNHYHFEIILSEDDALNMKDFCKTVLDEKEGMLVKVFFGKNEIEDELASQAFKNAIFQLFGQAVNLISNKKSH